MKLLPLSRTSKLGTFLGLAVVLLIIFAYLSLLALEAYSARRAANMLDKLELLRMGDPAEDFGRAVRGCKVIKNDSEYLCVATSGAFWLTEPWVLLAKLLPDKWSYRLSEYLNRAGLRYWRLAVSASVQQGRIERLSVRFFVNGRYEQLGADWALVPELSQFIRESRRLSADQLRTYLGWFHIMSVPSGEGFKVLATKTSTERELRARRINRKCLFSFRGCDGLCELLPDAVPVLNHRGQGWGGCTGAPRSRCEPKNDSRGSFR
jgi:hypothetical protein